MKEKIIKITHVTGTYNIIVDTSQIDQVRNYILACLMRDQAAFTSGVKDGKEQIFPAEFLKASLITIEDYTSDYDVI